MTDIIILRICRRLHASPLLTWNIRNSRFLRVFDLSGPRRIVGAAILATGLTKKNTSQRLWTTCSHAHAEYSLSLTRYIIDEDPKKNPPLFVSIDESTFNDSMNPHRWSAFRDVHLFRFHGKRVSDSDLSHHSDRFLWMVRHRCTRRTRDPIEISQRDL